MGAARLTRTDGGRIQLAISPSAGGSSGGERVLYLALLSHRERRTLRESGRLRQWLLGTLSLLLDSLPFTPGGLPVSASGVSTVNNCALLCFRSVPIWARRKPKGHKNESDPGLGFELISVQQ